MNRGDAVEGKGISSVGSFLGGVSVSSTDTNLVGPIVLPRPMSSADMVLITGTSFPSICFLV